MAEMGYRHPHQQMKLWDRMTVAVAVAGGFESVLADDAHREQNLFGLVLDSLR